MKLAHRISWELHNGPITEGMNVNHKCNVAHCVNPEHLYVGTQKQNVRDSINAGNFKGTQNLPNKYSMSRKRSESQVL